MREALYLRAAPPVSRGGMILAAADRRIQVRLAHAGAGSVREALGGTPAGRQMDASGTGRPVQGASRGGSARIAHRATKEAGIETLTVACPRRPF